MTARHHGTTRPRPNQCTPIDLRVTRQWHGEKWWRGGISSASIEGCSCLNRNRGTSRVHYLQIRGTRDKFGFAVGEWTWRGYFGVGKIGILLKRIFGSVPCSCVPRVFASLAARVLVFVSVAVSAYPRLSVVFRSSCSSL